MKTYNRSSLIRIFAFFLTWNSLEEIHFYVCSQHAMVLHHEPPEGHLDRGGQARCEEISREFRVHREDLVRGAGGQLDAVPLRYGRG